VLTASPLALLASSAFAQHVANPYVGAKPYLNPDYANEVAAVAAQTTNATLKAQMQNVAAIPTAVWMDKMAAITGGSANSGRLGLSQHITAALSQAQGSEPVVITLVIYDLPQRDCAALASNGEISIAPNPPAQPLSGIATYEQDYITPIYNILAPYATNTKLRFVLVIEPDSLPNMVTNTGLSFTIPNCVAANNGQTGSASLSGVYVQGIQYAISKFHALPNVYQYLDVGHSAWLGWPTNMTPAVSFYTQIVQGTAAGFSTIDGFISNTANYTPTKEPYMAAYEDINGNDVYTAYFYQYNPNIDEADYDAALYSAFVNAGFPSSIGFLIDTSRNGWGGSNRPTGPSGSNSLNTFVNATKIDERDDRGQWCNQDFAGLGEVPTADPPGYFPQLEAFVWVKPPGESDGTYAASTGYTGGGADENCDPAHYNALANNTLTDALPNSPPSGTFFPAAFTMMVGNAYPAIPVTGFTVAAVQSDVTVKEGASAKDTINITGSGGFAGKVTLSASGLPAGVTASFTSNPTKGTSKLVLAAASTTPTGASTVTVTGVSGAVTSTTSITLTVKK
jgi:cellulose 1,4-beta-cellobiosidase